MPAAPVGDRLPGDRSSGRSVHDAISVSAATASTVMVPTVATVTAPVAAKAAVQKDV